MWVCFSIINRYRWIDGYMHQLPKINHIQGENGKTLCGIEIGLHWDFDLKESEFNLCHRCARKQVVTTTDGIR
jgi:hypothetical protein